MFSEGTYYGTRPGDLDQIFGSLNDYIIDQTNSNHNLVGRNGQPVIINDADPNDPNLVEWMILQHDREYYNDLTHQSVFINTIIQEIEAEYGINELKSYNVIGFIFAGNNTSGYFGAAARAAQLSDGTYVLTFRVPEFDVGSVVHIGLIAHEFSHQAFGLQDEYKGEINPGTHCLMANGLYNGPNGASGSCPAPINLGYKVDLGWVIPEIITKGTFDKTLNFDTIYKVEMYGETDQYFLLNMYEDEGFYEFTPSETYAMEQGLSIWHWHKTFLHYDWAEVELASGPNLKFPADKNGLQSFNDYSTVNSRKRDSTLSDVAINDIDVNVVFGPLSFEVILDVIDPAPQTPQNFAGTIYNNAPKVTWDYPNEPDIAYFEVWRKIDGGSWTLKATTTSTSYTDVDFIIGGRPIGVVYYKIRAKDIGNNFSPYTNQIYFRYSGMTWKVVANNNENSLSKEYLLENNYPNPFNPSTQISYSLAQDADVTLRVYDILGTQVAELVNEKQTAGSYDINFNSEGLASGVYIYHITASNNGRILFTDTKQMILLR